MSSSPICSEYKFPVESPGSVQPQLGFGFPTAPKITNEPLSLCSSIHLLADKCSENTRSSHEADYFGMSFEVSRQQTESASTLISPRKSSLRDGAGSISSINSVSTVVSTHLGTFPAPDFSHSTETLVEESFESNEKIPGSQKNILLLSLNMPRRTLPPSLFRSASSQRTESDSLFMRSDMGRKPPHSSTGTQFDFSRKVSANLESFQTIPGQGRASSIPLLRKQATTPSFPPIHEVSLLNNQQRRKSSFVAPQTNFRDSILALSPTICYMSPEEVTKLILEARTNPELNLKNVLPIDIRPFTDFVKSHLTGAINVCLPLTLLKRQNFNLKKCINSLPAYENIILQNYVQHNSNNQNANLVCDNLFSGKFGLPTLIVYDHYNNSSNLLHMCKKLIDLSCWDAVSAPTIVLVNCSFDDFALNHPETLTPGKADMIDLDQLRIKTNALSGAESPSSNNSDTYPGRAVRSLSTPGFTTIAKSGSCASTAISNFFLPQDLPSKTFRIRHNEEIFNTSNVPCAEDNLSAIALEPSESSHLPKWLVLSIKDKCKIRADFNKLEKKEKERLNCAFNGRTSSELEKAGELAPSISSGLDYGHKNRYKDIFLFDHSRVKLMNQGITADTELDVDYINASYLLCDDIVQKFSNFDQQKKQRFMQKTKYLATQGPMAQTAGDFWRCVVDQRSLVIISLSAEFENGSEKCYPFWVEGVYYSGNHELRVLLEETSDIGNITHRVFSVSMDNQEPHKVSQIHHQNWKDMTVDVDIEDVLQLTTLKKQILDAAAHLPPVPTVVHCSAGCGRTGVFCVVDLLINIFRETRDYEFAYDPIFEIVDSLRRQRVLMVQTVRQYSFLYKTMVRYILGRKHGSF